MSDLFCAFGWLRCRLWPARVKHAKNLDELLSRGIGEADGVFEYRQIAWVPNLLLHDERSVSIVTRYWGDAPEHMGFEIHGWRWLLAGGDCSNGVPTLGTVAHHAYYEGYRNFRTLLYPGFLSPMTADQTAFLQNRFGPPVEVPVPAPAIAAAWFLILWQPVLVLVVVVGGYALLVRRWRRRRREQSAFMASTSKIGREGLIGEEPRNCPTNSHKAERRIQRSGKAART